MDIVLKGVLSGILLTFLIGPVFFTIIQTSIEKGFSTGVLVAFGVSLSDTFYIVLTYLGLSQLLDNANFKLYMAYIGGTILFLFGIYYLFVKNRKMNDRSLIETQPTGFFRYMIKGFIINGLSPMVWVFWIGAVSFATTELGYETKTKAIIYFGSILVTVFTTDIIKAKLADKLRLILTPRFIRLMNIVLGIAFVIFGGRLIMGAGQF